MVGQKGTVYLAGPIAGWSYDGCTTWRREAARWLGPELRCLDPLRDYGHLAEETCLGEVGREHVLTRDRAVTTRDRLDLSRADVVLMCLAGARRVSVGTMVELGWADAWRKPVVLVMEAGNVHEHAFLRDLVGFHVETLAAAIPVVQTLLGASVTTAA